MHCHNKATDALEGGKSETENNYGTVIHHKVIYLLSSKRSVCIK